MLNKILELFIDIKARPSNKGTKAFKSTSYEALGDPPPQKLQTSITMQTLDSKSLK